MSKPIRMKIFGTPATKTASSGDSLKLWKNKVREAAQREADNGNKIKGDCHLYVVFFLPSEEAFKKVDVDNLLRQFCHSLQEGGVIGKRATVLGIKAHKSIAREKEQARALAILVPTEKHLIKDVSMSSGKDLYEGWQRKMQVIQTNRGKFVDNMPGELWGFRDEGAEPGFNWEAFRKQHVRGVSTFYHAKSEKWWINKWSTLVLAYHVAEDKAVDISGAPKHIKFDVTDKRGPATQVSPHVGEWRKNARSAVQRQVLDGKIIEEDCHLYVVFYIPKGKNLDGHIQNMLKVFCDQLGPKKDKQGNIAKGIIKDDAHILGIKAHKQTVGNNQQPGAFVMLIPTEKPHEIKEVTSVRGNEIHDGWKYDMQMVKTNKGDFIDNKPNYLWDYPYPGVEFGYEWKKEEGRKVYGIVTYTIAKDSNKPYINKWDMELLMQGVRKDRPPPGAKK